MIRPCLPRYVQDHRLVVHQGAAGCTPRGSCSVSPLLPCMMASRKPLASRAAAPLRGVRLFPHVLRRSWSALGGALVALALASGCGTTTGPAPRGHQAPPVRAATADLLDPTEVVSKDGLLKTTIVVERKKVELAGGDLWAMTYNGLYMPPTLRLKPGDRMEITFENKLDQQTNLHVHGMHVAPGDAADNVFLSVEPGGTFEYRYAFPKDHRPGTYWYHPHAHSLSTAQVAGGMAGLVVVDGLDQYLPQPLRGITEHTVALKDFQITGDEIKTTDLKMNADTTRTVNGQVNPRIRIRPGETQLWRIANIGANIFYKVALPGSAFHVVAQDGYPVREAYRAESLVIPAGSRYDVLVQGGPAGTTELQTLPYDSGRTGGQFPQATLATVESAGAEVEPGQLPTGFAPVEELGQEPLADSKTITFTESRDNTLFYVNGRAVRPRPRRLPGQAEHGRGVDHPEQQPGGPLLPRAHQQLPGDERERRGAAEQRPARHRPRTGAREHRRTDPVPRLPGQDGPALPHPQPRGRGHDGGAPDRRVGRPRHPRHPGPPGRTSLATSREPS